MRKYILNLFFCTFTFLLLSCSEDELGGQGTLALSLRMGTDTAAVTRTLPTLDELNNSCVVKLRNAGGELLREYEGLGTVPQSLELQAGSYTIGATAGIKVDAAFDAPYYSGSVDFEIQRNQTVPVTLPLYLQNTVIETAYSETAKNKFKSCKVTVSMSKGSLLFDKAIAGQTGFFLLPKGETEMDWQLEAVTTDDIPYTKTGVLKGVKSSTKYTLNFDYTEKDPEDGGMAIIVNVAEEPILKAWSIEMGRPPRIERYEGEGFHTLSDPVNFAIDDAGKDVDVFVLTTSELKSLTLTCNEFISKVGLKSTSIDVLTMAGNIQETIKDKVVFSNYYDDKTDCSVVKMTFKALFFAKFAAGEEGDYLVNIKAIDANAKTRDANLRILVSNAIVTTEPVKGYDVWALRTYVTANVNKLAYDAAISKELAFEYRKQGTEQWEKQAATLDAGNSSRMSAQLSSLTPGTTYEFRAWCSGQSSESPTYKFTTETTPQLQNSGFENWSQPSKPLLLYGSGEPMFWDSGNWGSTTLSANDNVTVYDEAIKAPGTKGARSVRMKSAFVGLGSIGKFAAGNAFVGKYIKTIGTTGAQIGFGRPHASRPVKLRGYLKYRPVAINYTELNYVAKGELDNAHIYVSVGDWDYVGGAEGGSGDKDVPFLVDTSAKKFFDKTGKGVIAYGEKIQAEATLGEEMIPFEIELKYKDTTRKAKYIILVTTSSRYGDYFTGGTGSTLWLDDLELVYE